MTIPTDLNQHYKNFLNEAGFRNGKEHPKDALLLNIVQRDNQIQISPTINGGYTGKDRGFFGMKVPDIIANGDIDNQTLAYKIKQGWTICECK